MSAHAEYAKDIEMFAGKIAGNSTDVVVLECARTIAETEIDLARIRRLKVALISHVNALGEVKPGTCHEHAFGAPRISNNAEL
jgi:hypothetical protein